MIDLPLEWERLEAVLRLAVAAAIGMIVGLNRDMHGKPTGMRTLGLVSLAAALVSLAGLSVGGMDGHPDATSRVVQGIIQGVLTGIGFIGAGVVLRNPKALEVYGLTTAATVLVTAALGIAAALANWELVLAALLLAIGLLIAPSPTENEHGYGDSDDDDTLPEDGDATAAVSPGRGPERTRPPAVVRLAGGTSNGGASKGRASKGGNTIKGGDTMERIDFEITGHEGAWQVTGPDGAGMSYPTREAAFESAVIAASTAIKEGAEISIVVRGRPGQALGERRN
ncbi:MgtC family protein [Pseudoxanthobacter soli DSM 19599]|uniref:Protein MgtC n=1 Tax=Pseudoxanthobacter soli DSM 19599 TaxID=1123029 RepID=A0A1M7ZPP2_9HYPH|nr:MgtC/SapB family protein [Pseudoxanthobacter soli]SHO66837.1 MgtC family protein [Pseudoxanthobacter soli DSM 19599]